MFDDAIPSWLRFNYVTPVSGHESEDGDARTGRSLVRRLVDAASPKLLPASVLRHLRRDEERQDGALPVGGAYVEYHGIGPTGASSAPWFRQQDALNNTYRALRVIDRRQGGLGNVLYLRRVTSIIPAGIPGSAEISLRF
jgi:hypothetical protein